MTTWLKRISAFALVLTLSTAAIFYATPRTALAAISIDNTSESGTISLASSATWSHTNTAGNAIVVTVHTNAAADCNGGQMTVTYNGASLTKAVENTSQGYSVIWYLISPDTGAHNVVVTCTSSTMTGEAGAVSLSGTNISDFVEATASTNGSAQASSLPITCGGASPTCIIIDDLSVDYTFGTAYTPTAGQTKFVDTPSLSNGGEGGSGYEIASSSGTYTQSWSWNGGFNESFGATALAINGPACDATAGVCTAPYTSTGYSQFTVPASVTSVDIACWSGGGGGGDGGSSGGGAGGGGGAFASSTQSVTVGDIIRIFVAGGGAGGGSGAAGASGATTTASTTVPTTLVAPAPGWGGAINNGAGGLGGAVASSTGTTIYAGGKGGAGDANGTTQDTGGGGGGGGGPHGAGGGGAIGQATNGGGGGGGDNGATATTVTGGSSTAGGAGGNGGDTVNGLPGTANANGGGGAGGGDNGLAGGIGGAPSGGGGGGENGGAAGAIGRCTLTYTGSVAVAAATSTPARLNIIQGQLIVRQGQLKIQ